MIWAFDTEDDSKGNPFLFNFFNGLEHHTFTEAEKAIEFLIELKGVNKIWACNLQYDLANLFYHFPGYCEITYAGSRVISAKIPHSKIRFYDTLNHWKISVEKMGERIGLPKLKHGGNFNNVEYCRRDTEIVFHFVKRMLGHYQKIGAKPKSTIGSTALAHFTECVGADLDFQKKIDSNALEFMCRGFYGGRTECFYNKPIKGHIQVFDFNSLYPSVLRDHYYPSLSSYYWTAEINLENEGVAHVTVESPTDLYLPYLPYRDCHSVLYFPLGNFTGHYTYFELREAQKIGYKIKRVHRAVEFDGGVTKPFENWVDEHYKNRRIAQKSDDALLSETHKNIMNNLFGKFAQGNEKTKLLPITKDLLKKHSCVILDNKFILVNALGEYPVHTNYIWACYCTAYARHKLYLAMQKVISKGARLLYCDTDSIFFESKKQIFKDSKELGELKLEGILKSAYFKGLKNYRLEKENGEIVYKVRGVPRPNAAEIFENNIVQFRKPYRLREVLRRNSSKNREIILVPNYWDTVTKQHRKNYDKRKVLKNGDTKPRHANTQGVVK